MASEKEKMLTGHMYNAADPVLVAERATAHAACRAFNHAPTQSPATLNTLLDLFSDVGKNIQIEPPFFCDYGYNISLGRGVFINFNATILDCARVHIGDFVKFGPGVQLYTAGHSLNPVRRRAGDEFALPITIEEDVWVGGSAIILPGVRVGRGAVVGAGAVVTKNVPPGATVVGSPARER